MTRAKLMRRYVLLCIASFIVLISPLVSVLIAKREVYFTKITDVWKISIGGGICLLLILLMILGKLRVPGGVVALAVVCILSWLLDPILDDLFLLSCCALSGKVVDWIFFEPRIRRLRKLLDMHEQANINATETEGVLKKYIGRV